MISLQIRGILCIRNVHVARQLILNKDRVRIITCERCSSWVSTSKEIDDVQEFGALIKEFPRPTQNLMQILYEVALKLQTSEWQPKITSQRTAGGKTTKPVWRTYIAVNWPEKFYVEAQASEKKEAEKIAALLACKKIKEYGVLDTRLKPIVQNQTKGDKHSKRAIGNIFGLVAQKFQSKHWHPQYVSHPVKVPGSRERHGWETTLSMKWPRNHTVEGVGLGKVDAETAAAKKALLWLREQDVLDRRDFPILYSKEEKKEFFDSRRAPVPIEIPSNLVPMMEGVVQDYHSVKTLLDEVNEYEADEEEEEPNIFPRSPQMLERRSAELLQKYRQRMNSDSEDVIAMSEKQRSLPIFDKREEILKIFNQNQVVVLSGETGCGKTTQIPQYILDKHIKNMKGASCNIVVTQPRRISAISIAHRIADERQERIGDTVGYQVRLQSKYPRGNGSILFCSTGILLQRLHSDPTLQNISHLIVDEIHERDVQTDILLTLLKSIVRLNSSLKVVLMSATLNAEMFASYFNNCPIISVPGFVHPVTEHYLPEITQLLNFQAKLTNVKYPQVDYELIVRLIKYIDQSQPFGAILCFLPGWQDIKTVSERLQVRFGRSSNHLICPVHSLLPPRDQHLIFSLPPTGVRKIVLATNIAETSITIDDVVYVVDSGLHKETAFDAERGVACLETHWISKANAKQRKGRAGRVQPGHCFKLYDKRTHQNLEEYSLPEILRTPLEKVVLDCKLYCPSVSAAEFLSKAPQPPDCETIEKAVSDLQQLKILDSSERLTPLGKKVAYFSTHPRLSVALVMAAFLRCVQPVTAIAAFLSATKNPFLVNMDNKDVIKQIKKKYDGDRYSDHLSMVGIYNEWLNTTSDQNSCYNFCRSNQLHSYGMNFVHGLQDMIARDMQKAEFVRDAEDCFTNSGCNFYAKSDGMALGALCAALYPNVIRIYKGEMGRCMINAGTTVPMTLYGMEVAISKESVSSKESALPSPWLIYFSAMKSQQRRQILVREVSLVPSLLLFLSVNQDATMVRVGDNVCLTVGNEARMKFVCSAKDAVLLRDFQSCFSSLFWHFLATCNNPASTDKSIDSLRSKFLTVLEELFRTNYRHTSVNTERKFIDEEKLSTNFNFKLN